MEKPDINVQQQSLNFAIGLAGIRAQYGQCPTAAEVVDMAKAFQNFIEGKP